VTFPPLYALEILAGGFVPMVAAVVLAALGGIHAWALGVFALAWYGAELLLCYRYDWPASPRGALMLLARDLLLPVVWFVGWTGDTFVWRGNAMDIGGDSDLGRSRAAATTNNGARLGA
jgi:ceramide glucosyltransferase